MAYDSDLEKVQEVVNQVGMEIKEDPDWDPLLFEAPTWVGVTELGDSAVTVRCQVRVRAGSQWEVERELNRRMKVAFDAAGIEIPFPQQVVHHINS